MANEASGSRSLEVTASILPHRPRLATTLWWIMLLSCVAIGGYSTRYFLGLPSDAHFSRYILPLRLHIAGGIGALLTGPWQFSEKLRARALNLHRWLGRFYLLEVALGSIAGFAMATVSEQGWPTHLGFGILAVLWFFYGPASVPDGAKRRHRGAPPVDDPQLRADSSSGDASQLLTLDAPRVALVFPIVVYHHVMAVLDSEFAHCRMDCAAGKRSGSSRGHPLPGIMLLSRPIPPTFAR
jgi:Predicted membrane protein (DUF2306)